MIKYLINKKDIDLALILIKDSFLKFVAPDYSKEGVNEFLNTINDNKWINNQSFIAYFIDGEIVGIIATRNQNSHISLFFVKDSFMGKGIGRKLINEIIINNKNEKVTVHSSPFAVKIYEKLGFIKTSQEKCINGMLFIEMEHLIDK